MTTIGLLIISNIFMTFAWYGQLKFPGWSIPTAIFVGWGIALFEYCFAVPANRIGYFHGFTGGQLKIIQECVTLAVFVVFAWLVLKEKMAWNYAVSFAFIVAAVWFATAFKPGGPSGGGH